jgi:hypothetical protein
VVEDLCADGGRGAVLEPAGRGGDHSASHEPGAVGLREADDFVDVADLLVFVVIYEERDGPAVREEAQRVRSLHRSAGPLPGRIVVPHGRVDRSDSDQRGVRHVATLPRRA